ncbi:MAG: DEAD/DEAH box helicase [Chloroflexi bacterium]|nr:DEAD/DEAH box helicase [Chloroflexota bacterium]
MNQIYVSLDLEMTGPRPEDQEVIEIGVVKFRGSRVIDTWSTLVNPQVPLPYSVQMLTGIQPDDLTRAPLLADVVEQLRAFVQDYPLVAHTISADVGCLERSGVKLTNPQIDTFELASVLLPMLPSYSLAALAEHFKIPFAHKHRAVADALATKQLFVKLWETAVELDPAILQEINRLVGATFWPLAGFFRQVEQEKTRAVEGTTSIRQRLAARVAGESLPVEFLLYGREPDPPLEPVSPPKPVDVDETARLVEPGGALAHQLSGFEHRPQQAQMLRAVAEALNEGRHLVVEAGTGTGKSLAYLVPAITFGTKNNARVVVSTNTINLQDQLHQKDLPDLRRVLPYPFRWTLVKGRANYLCLTRLAAMRRRADLSLAELITLVKILVWLPNTQTGDVNELNLTEVERAVWSKLNATHEVCTPRGCASHRRGVCFLARARRLAECAHIVVVNHALLFSDIATNNKVLPEYQHLIVDEAHHLESEATEQLAYEIRQRQVLTHLDEIAPTSSGERAAGLMSDALTLLRQSRVPGNLVSRVQAAGEGLPAKIQAAREATTLFFGALGQFLRQASKDNRGYDPRLRIVPALRKESVWQPVPPAWERLALCLIDLQEHLSKLGAVLGEIECPDVPDYEVLQARVQGMLAFNEALRVQGSALVGQPDPGRIYWVSGGQAGDVGFHSAPLHVDQVLKETLFGLKRTVITTSATLSTAGRFDFIQGRLGLQEARTLAVGSPFDYERSTLFCIPIDMPEPETPNYGKQLPEALINLCTATEGRALVLFTSHSQLRQTWQAIHRPLADKGILVLGHGIEGTARRHLLERFKTNPRTVLLGAASFWEGVDVVGDALSVLVIARLPFNVPSDPIFAARSELFDDPFQQYSLPQTILRFKQGFGRLIRSSTDRGAVVVLDRRLQTKSYGNLFLSSLPKCTVRIGPLRELPNLVTAWLRPASRAEPRLRPAKVPR